MGDPGTKLQRTKPRPGRRQADIGQGRSADIGQGRSEGIWELSPTWLSSHEGSRIAVETIDGHHTGLLISWAGRSSTLWLLNDSEEDVIINRGDVLFAGVA
ncbi:MAG: hypothetical protein ACYCS7_10610 [Acidimicrobiales bacterium]